MPSKKCPHCGLYNYEIALRCDCGYDFQSGQIQQSYLSRGKPALQAERFPTFLPVTSHKSAMLFVQDKLFTSFHGRIPRAQWWLGSVLIILSQALLMTLVETAGGKVELVQGFIWLLTLVPHLAINIKRCHDRDRSGWFILLTFIPLVNLWYIVEVGFLPGTKGNNRFGPDPLADK